MTACYVEIDPYCAQWLRNLIDAGHIAPGIVDTRSVEDITPNELRSFSQVHLFAGIGIWSHALRASGWEDDQSCWTISCPCQPFSSAGKGVGFDDERHLWPSAQHLLAQLRPGVVFGEQVASKDAEPWLDLVQDDMEGMGYAFGAVAFPAASVGAPHIRDRSYWLADAGGSGPFSGTYGTVHRRKKGTGSRHVESQRCGAAGRLGDTSDTGPQGHGRPVHLDDQERREGTERHGATAGFWDNAEWIRCRDGKQRPIEPGTFPLAPRTSNHVGRLRAYGNALNAKAAIAFISAYMDCRP